VRRGELPDEPYIVIGQQSIADASRAPEGSHTLWAYSHVPARAPHEWRGCEATFADRLESTIERLAPGFRQRILARAISAPDTLEQGNANLVGGDLGGGSSVWHHQLLFRPVFPYFRYRMPVQGLFLCSSAAHPGGGVHGMSGFNAARAALREHA
jgi:phytoene dehydrogenase-like protein